ncbi:MAG TPA: protein kinase [Blastocatellia bacterium]|nr:protein kinase [Blastocatellia bacterium]
MIGSLVGNYKITEKIGEGGMGAVFRGIDIMLEREVAIKMLRPELSSQPNIVERFRSEAVTLAKLNHPNIATLYSFVRHGDDFFMVMEFVRGDTLDAVIRKSGAMNCDRAIRLFCQALEGIDHAHRMGIIHRDIKPANMMLTETGTLKVMDFGIARVLGTARMTKQGNIVGTIEYMSPEQVRGQETDARSDIYALGILLYEMLTGRVPFASDSEYDLMRMQIEDAPPPPRVFAAGIPPGVEQAIMRALAKRPDSRFRTAGELRDVLLAAIGTPSSVAVTPASPHATQVIGAPLPAPAQPTQAIGPAAPTAPGSEPKETRLAGEATAAYGGDQLKETRLANQPAPLPAYAGFQQPVAAVSPPGKSNAKLFIGIAAAVVVVVIGVVVALLTLGKTETVAPASPPTQPVKSATPTPSPAPQSMPAQPPPQSIPQPDSFKPVERLPAGSLTPVDNANAPKVAKSSRKESDAEAAARKEKARKAAEARKLLSQ